VDPSAVQFALPEFIVSSYSPREPFVVRVGLPVLRGGSRLEAYPPGSSQLGDANTIPSSQCRDIADVSLPCRSGGVSGVNYSPSADFMFGGEGGLVCLAYRTIPPPYSLGEVVEL